MDSVVGLANLRFFRALCQNPRCRRALGGLHFPAVGGLVFFDCEKCRHVSIFKSALYGIETGVASQADFNQLLGSKK